MKRVFLLCAALLVFSLSQAQDAGTLLKENPERYAGVHHSYEAPAVMADTPAPKGYEAFYVSHYGRHGSRYHTSMNTVTRVSYLFDGLDSLGVLSAEGQALHQALKALEQSHEDQAGYLTLRGGREHQGIAQRLYKRVPGVFAQSGRDRVVAESSYVQRCIQSLADDYPDLSDILGFFTEDELYNLWYCENLSHFDSMANTLENGCRFNETGRKIIADFVKKADAAIAGNDVAADLRFGHDSGLLPLLSYLRLEGYQETISMTQAAERGWYSFQQMPMGSNLQLIFYRDKRGDVLVKILRNEQETTIPALKPYKGPYYRWKDLRAYLVNLP